MRMCILAGFNLYNEPWVDGYLENPDFIEYTDYYVKKATSQDLNSNPVSSEENSDSEAAQLSRKSDQELNDLLNQDEYYFERFHKKSQKNLDKKNSADLAMNIYKLIKYHYTNPMSLKDLSRIAIRTHLLSIDYKMKFKIENGLPLPNRLKNYLLFKEFLN